MNELSVSRCGTESNGVSLQSLSSSNITQSGLVSVSYSPRRTNMLNREKPQRIIKNHIKDRVKKLKILRISPMSSYISPKSLRLGSSTPENRVFLVVD